MHRRPPTQSTVRQAGHSQFELTDNQLMQLISEGEYSYFENLAKKYNSSLYRFGRAYGLSHKDALDAVQETQVAAFAALSRNELQEDYLLYILKRMAAKCIIFYRKPASFHTFSNEEIIKNTDLWYISSAWHRNKPLAKKEYVRLVERSLEQLPEQHAEIFVLSAIEGLTSEDVALVLGINELSVKIALSRLHILLQDKLEKVEETDSIYALPEAISQHLVERIFNGINAIISV